MDVGTSKASATWLNPGPLKWPILQLDGQRGRRELLFFAPGGKTLLCLGRLNGQMSGGRNVPVLSSASFAEQLAGKRGYDSLGERRLPCSSESLLQKQAQRAGELFQGEFSGETTESSFRDLVGGLQQSCSW